MDYGTQLVRVMAYYRKIMDHAMPPPLTETRFYTLWEINEYYTKHGSGMKVSDLSQILHIARPSATRLTNDLEEQGLIKKERTKMDRRNTYLYLTDQGNFVLQKTVQLINEFTLRRIDHLSKQEKELLEDLINKVIPS